MGYRLGVDLGTTFTAAAVERDGRAEVVPLGDHAPQIPSVLFAREDGQLLVGTAAVRRGGTQPDRVAREFKRRLGDRVPLLLGGEEFGAEQLTAELLRWVVAAVVERQGAPPERLALTHPANWGRHRLATFLDAVRAAGVGAVTTITEPAAAAVHFASTERAAEGDVLLVYDLGGGTFDTAVLRRTRTEFELLGSPEGVEQLGGIDFDDGVFRHVLRGLGPAGAELDPDAADVVAGLAQLRRDCTEAKEALSSDSEVFVQVRLPGIATAVRLTRSEFEDVVRPSVEQTLGCLRRALASAHVEPEDVATVVLVGGSARIPLVAEVLGRELGRPVSVSPQPKHAVALGAALLAGGALPPSDAGGRRGPRGTPSRSPSTGSPAAGASSGRSGARAPQGGARTSPGGTPGREGSGTPSRPAPRPGGAARVPGVLAAATALLALVLAFVVAPAVGRGEFVPRTDRSLARATGPFDLTIADLERVAAGPVPVTTTDPSGAPVRQIAGPAATPSATVSFWAPVLIVLFVGAYVEAVLGPVRRRRRPLRRADVARMTALGAVSGLALTLASWNVTAALVPLGLVAVVVALCAAAGGCTAAFVGARAARRSLGRRRPGGS